MNSATARKDMPLESFAATVKAAAPAAAPAAATGKRAWDIAVYADYAALEPAWMRLEEQGCCTAFQSYDWASCWYDTAASTGAAAPLVVAVSQEGAGIVWILPLCIHRKGGAKIISFADLGISDYVAPLMSRAAPRDRAAIRSIMKAVVKALPPCDAVHFQKIPEKAGEMDNPLARLRGLRAFQTGCHGISLGRPWPELSRRITQSRTRSLIRRQRKAIEREGPVAFEFHESRETLVPALDRLMEMRRKRYAAIGRADLPEGWRGFYPALVSREHRGIRPLIATMTVGGREIASCFGFTRGKTCYAILPAFEMGKWEPYRPGLLLFDAMLSHFSAREGRWYFDFTVGDEVYKKRLGCEKHPLYEWMLPRSVRGLFVCACWQAKETLRGYPRLFRGMKKAARYLRPEKKPAP